MPLTKEQEHAAKTLIPKNLKTISPRVIALIAESIIVLLRALGVPMPDIKEFLVKSKLPTDGCDFPLPK